MTAKVLAFYCIGAGLLVAGLISGICAGFDSTAWWLIGAGALSGIVGLLVQLGVLYPPDTESK